MADAATGRASGRGIGYAPTAGDDDELSLVAMLAAQGCPSAIAHLEEQEAANARCESEWDARVNAY